MRLSPHSLVPRRPAFLDVSVVAALSTVAATLLFLMAWATHAFGPGPLSLSALGRAWCELWVYSLAIGYAIHLLGEWPRLLRPHWRTRVPTLLVRLVAVPLGFWCGASLASLLLGTPARLPLSFEPSDLLVVALTLLVSGVAIVVTHQQDRLEAARLRAENAEMRAASARLQLLQQQIEPHMLFNTLANAHALIDDDPQRAQRLLEALSELLHASMQSGEQAMVPLQQEFDLVAHYLRLMAIRMGPRMQYRLSLPPELAQVRLPPLTLQPLVENAIKHGLANQVSGGMVQLVAQRRGEWLRIDVLDDGPGLPSSDLPPSRVGIGLSNVRQRLIYAFGPAATVELSSRPEGGVQVCLRFPIALPET